MKNQKLVSLRPIIVITASAILSVLFILILYYADNKYTVGGKQPELGRLELTLGIWRRIHTGILLRDGSSIPICFWDRTRLTERRNLPV